MAAAPSSLFRRLIGAPFDRLPGALRAVHEDRAETRLAGRCRIERGRGALSTLVAAIASLPRANEDAPVRVSIVRSERGETWTRHFDGKPLRSSLRESGGLLEESLGPVRFRFVLAADQGTIVWRVAAVHALGFLPLPASWFSKVAARESVEGGRYRFDVRAEMPVVGLLVHYRGTLDVER